MDNEIKIEIHRETTGLWAVRVADDSMPESRMIIRDQKRDVAIQKFRDFWEALSPLTKRYRRYRNQKDEWVVRSKQFPKMETFGPDLLACDREIHERLVSMGLGRVYIEKIHGN
jgi:hypothetical protein